MVLPFIVLGLWIAALYFFLRSLTNWQVKYLFSSFVDLYLDTQLQGSKMFVKTQVS